MIRVEVPGTAALPTLRHGVWHKWGLAASADFEVSEVDGPRHLLESMHTVIVPSYWGAVRQQQLALALLAAEINPGIITLADAVCELDPPTLVHSVLVEVERNRVCVTRLSGSHHASRMTHLVGADDGAAAVETVIALAYQLTIYPDSPLGLPDDVEVTGGRGITEYPPRWQEEIELIVAEVAPGLPTPRRGLLVDRLRDRGFYAFDCPASRLAEPKLGRFDVSEGLDSNQIVDACESMEPSEPGGIVLPARNREGLDARRPRRSPSMRRASEPIAVIGGVVLLVAIAALGLLLVGTSDDSNDGNTHGGSDGGVNSGRIEAGGDSGAGQADLNTEQSKSGNNRDTQALKQPHTPNAMKPPGGPGLENRPEIVLSEDGVAASFPNNWEKDPTSPLDRMIVTDGGDMRVLVVSNTLSPGAGLDHLVAGLSSHSATDETKSSPQRRWLDGTEVVVVEERLPSGKSVVLWHHKIVEGKQISVGCQFRGAIIAAERPVCNRAVLSARPAR